jgi:hypothetical protein
VTIQELGNIGEFVAAIATLATLVYLALQIRQNTQSVRAAAVDAAANQFIESLRLVSLNPELAELLEAGHHDYDSLPAVQRRRYVYHYFANALQFENLFQKHRDGFLPDAQWRRITGALRESFRREPGMQRAWKELRPLLSSEFQQLIELMLEARE